MTIRGGRMLSLAAVLFACVFVQSACGGGGGSATPSRPQTGPPAPIPLPSLSPPPPPASGNDWPEQRRDDQRTGNNPSQTTITKANVATLKVKWTQNFFGERAEPVVLGGVVYVADQGGYIYAFDENTGALRWKFLGNLGDPFKATPTIVNGILYDGSAGVGPHAGAMYAVNTSSGSLVWQHNYNEAYRALNGSPLVADGRIYGGRSTNNEGLDCVASGQLEAYDPNSGAILDQLNLTNAPVTGDDIWSGAMIDPNGAIYVASGNACGGFSPMSDALIKLIPKPLSIVWATQAVLNDNGTIDDDYGGTPLFVNGLIVDGNKNGNVYALNAASGAVVWTASLGGEMIASVATDGSKIYAVVDGGRSSCQSGPNCGGIFALDMSGHIIWSVETNYSQLGKALAPVAVSNGIVFAAYNQGVSALDSDTGAVLWRYQDPHNIQAGPVIVNGGLFIGEWDGISFFAFTPNGQ
ncbi:MAG: PQQ-binding-like beta-propeller repeat protein [Candidatus Eremiobacteraeota bacterium]|nr:PQQ-binding-like beta-propeller repeat protein [Candidatus Eremiobacteraeota bacterium]